MKTQHATHIKKYDILHPLLFIFGIIQKIDTPKLYTLHTQLTRQQKEKQECSEV